MNATIYKDANELLIANGASAVRSAIANAVPYGGESDPEADEMR